MQAHWPYRKTVFFCPFTAFSLSTFRLTSVLLLTVLYCGGGGGGGGESVAGMKEARPPDQGGRSGDHQQTLQDLWVVGQAGGAARSSSWDVVHVGDAGTGPGVGQVDEASAGMPERQSWNWR